MERGYCRTNTRVKRKKEIQKSRYVEITAKELSKGLTNQSIHEGRQTDVLSGPTHPLLKDVTQKNRNKNSKITIKNHTTLNANPLDSCGNSAANQIFICTLGAIRDGYGVSITLPTLSTDWRLAAAFNLNKKMKKQKIWKILVVVVVELC